MSTRVQLSRHSAMPYLPTHSKLGRGSCYECTLEPMTTPRTSHISCHHMNLLVHVKMSKYGRTVANIHACDINNAYCQLFLTVNMTAIDFAHISISLVAAYSCIMHGVHNQARHMKHTPLLLPRPYDALYTTKAQKRRSPRRYPDKSALPTSSPHSQRSKPEGLAR